jgi:hypothetical protein
MAQEQMRNQPEQKDDQIEDHIGVTQSDAFAQATDGASVTGKVLFADGGDGKEKEATIRSHHAGASSEAPASSGIPSAEKQHGQKGEAFDRQTETSMADRTQPATQSTQ